MNDKDTLDYWNRGFELHQEEPDLIAAAVWHRAAKLTHDRELQFDFVYGYLAAVKQKAEYERERHGLASDQAKSRPEAD